MKISTKGRYALRVMIDLALNSSEKYVTSKEIAQRQEISNKYLEQIIAMLNKAGYLEAARGNTGGYKLTRKPSEYIIGDVLKATEGNLTPIDCLTKEGKCKRQGGCKTYSFWKGLDDTINEYVNSKTLEDLIK